MCIIYGSPGVCGNKTLSKCNSCLKFQSQRDLIGSKKIKTIELTNYCLNND